MHAIRGKDTTLKYSSHPKAFGSRFSRRGRLVLRLWDTDVRRRQGWCVQQIMQRLDEMQRFGMHENHA